MCLPGLYTVLSPRAISPLQWIHFPRQATITPNCAYSLLTKRRPAGETEKELLYSTAEVKLTENSSFRFSQSFFVFVFLLLFFRFCCCFLSDVVAFSCSSSSSSSFIFLCFIFFYQFRLSGLVGMRVFSTM